ncbi:MAG: ATP-binding protein [Eubacterium sp.]|nr:ATP-binding protein [Eubacterium sp.]
MGVYLNPGNEGFKKAVSSKIYVDKTLLIQYTNECLNTEQAYLCVSRPRRFGKSVTANMLAAYYAKGTESDALFKRLGIAACSTYRTHLNQYHVIFLNMQEFMSNSENTVQMLQLVKKSVLWDLLEEYPNLRYFDTNNLVRTLHDVYRFTKIPFVFIIDEWDCIFREKKECQKEQRQYLDFLRLLLKDQAYVALAYMTGILPIKKYGTHSALNMFDEYSMTNPENFAEFAGFTEDEVKALCRQYQMDFEVARQWYDGYSFEKCRHIYSPRSVVRAMLSGRFDSYWSQTETFDALKTYLLMNFHGLRDDVTRLLAGEQVKIDISSFSNDMTTFHTADDVLTLLVHLGYLAYDFDTKKVWIPNSEVAGVFATAVRTAGWDVVAKAIERSEYLLQAIWNQDMEKVAKGMEQAHLETSILAYNDENSLSCTIALALFSAREYYFTVRELPAGKGFSDIVYIPRKNHLDKPALVVELKWNQDAKGAIAQIKEKRYPDSIASYNGKVLLTGISYDKKTKKHYCEIEVFDTKRISRCN